MQNTVKKKLYKVKKNWVIGLVIGSSLILGSNINAYAENSISSTVNNDIVNTSTSDNAKITPLLTRESEQNNPIANKIQDDNRSSTAIIGMAPEIAQNQVGQYNTQNVGYINPDTEAQTSDAVPRHYYDSNYLGQTIYDYSDVEKESVQDVFSGNGNDLLKQYGENPKTYSYQEDHPKSKSIIDIPSVNNLNIHYLNNGVSNALQIQISVPNANYNSINNLSYTISYNDYNDLSRDYSYERTIDPDYQAFYDGKKKIINPKTVLTNDDLSALYIAAYKNRPKITYDNDLNGQRITSLLQTSINHSNDNWNLNYDTGWHAWTFQNGKQLSITDILRPETSDYSWLQTVTKYLSQALNANGIYRGIWIIDKQTKLPISDYGGIFTDTEYINNQKKYYSLLSNTSFAFLQDGVYVLIGSVAGGYDPVFVQLPMAFLKPEYQAFFNKNENIKIQPINNKNEDHQLPAEVDIDSYNKEYIRNSSDSSSKLEEVERGAEVISISGDSPATSLLDDVFNLLHHANKFINDFSSSLKDGLTGIKKFFSNLDKDTNSLHLLADIKSFWDDAKEPMKELFGNTNHYLNNTNLFPATDILNIGSDATELLDAKAKAEQSDKYEVSKNTEKNIKHFKDAREKKLNFYEKIISTFEDLADKARTFLEANLPVKILVTTIVGLAVVIGTPQLALLWYESTNNDDILLKKFRLKRKRKKK